MSGYKRFSDNSTQNNNSYKLFSEDHTNTNNTIDQLKQSPQELQRQKDSHQQTVQHQFHQQNNIQTTNQILPGDEEFKNKQLELRQKQQELQQARYQSTIPKPPQQSPPQETLPPQTPIPPQGSNIYQPPQIQNEMNEPPINNYQMTIDELQQRFPKASDVFIREVYRLLQAENTLTLEQAINLASVNGCRMDGYSDMCPSKPVVERFKQKGDCVGEDCNVTFKTEKVVENYEKSIVDKLKDLNITFYSNEGCGFCQQTKSLMNNADPSLYNSMTKSSKLPSGVRGYPHFVSQVSGKSHTGFPGTLERLHDLMS
jgi:hypothetical protein